MSKLLRIVAVAGLLASSCAAKGEIGVTLQEFSLQANPSETMTGEVLFRVHNIGAVDHNFVVVETKLAADELPISRQQVQTKAPGVHLIDKIDKIAPNETDALRLRLERGPYVLICDIPGHYQSGMRASFRVT